MVRVLGKGGVGVVYEAQHLRLHAPVAVKFLLPEMLGIEGQAERFEREARAMARLSSPNVVRVLDVDSTPEGVPYVVMEFLRGSDLQTYVKARGRLSVKETVTLVHKACLGIAEAHRMGIIHRDLKPANLFLTEDASGPVLKVVDFGISKILDEDVEVTQTQMSLGTPSYMSPEQIMSARDVDHRADIWSLGVILYRLLTGRLPFAGTGQNAVAVQIVTAPPPPLSEAAPDTPPALVAIIEKALAKNKEDRFQDVMALANALEGFLASAGPGMGPPSGRLALEPPPSGGAGRSANEEATLGPQLTTQHSRASGPSSRTLLGIALASLFIAIAGGVILLRTPSRSASAPASNPPSQAAAASASLPAGPGATPSGAAANMAPVAPSTSAPTDPPAPPPAAASSANPAEPPAPVVSAPPRTGPGAPVAQPPRPRGPAPKPAEPKKPATSAPALPVIL
jgi:eukaryotic-like serine/threonine-protein kinase